MLPSIASEYPDINYKKIYQGHKCFIDIDSANWHDYSDLTGFPDLDQFLELYRDCGLNETDWNWEDSVKPTHILTLLTLCKNCPHSKNALTNKSTTEEVYCLPNDKAHYASCPLENHFADGVEVHLKYPQRFNIICSHCKQTVPRPYLGKTSKLNFFDVRLNGTPTSLIVYRTQETCPHCKNHIAVDLIPKIQVDSKYQMSIRLIHAINDYSKNKGISGFYKRHIAQGYGISYELLKKFYRNTFEEIRSKAEGIYTAHIASRKTGESRASFSYSCITPYHTLTLCFSEVKRDTSSSEFCLCAAFDDSEIDVIDSWTHGDFSPALPNNLTDRHINFLAGHYAEIAFPGIDHLFAFRMTQLVIAYGNFLKSRRFATEAPEITNTLKRCLQVFSAEEDMDFYQFEQLIERIAEWSFCAHKQRIYRAAKRVLIALSTNVTSSFSTTLRARIQAATHQLTKEKFNRIKHIAYLIEISLLASAQWQEESDEDPKECYGTNSELAISRLLYVNPAVVYDRQDGSYTGTPLYGIPASALEELLKNGLLDDRGHSLTDIADIIPMQ